VKIIILRLTVAAAGLAAATCFDVSASRAGYYGSAPWCAVVDRGAGNLMWECEYNTLDDCAPAVLAGNRGFCNRNPYFQSWDPPPVAHPWHRKHQ
jgi:hypothetical protein